MAAEGVGEVATEIVKGGAVVVLAGASFLIVVKVAEFILALI
jgi:hypothetical protein